jgi:transposase
VRILLAAEPVDFRKGMDGLAALVQQALRADPFAGEVFIFRPRRVGRIHPVRVALRGRRRMGGSPLRLV